MYCTAIDSCPEGTRAMSALVPVDRLTARLSGRIETEEEARARATLLPLLKERVKRYEDELREWARAHGGGIRVAYDSWWGETDAGVRSIRPTPKAMAVLAGELGDEGAQRACKVSITQASIRKELESQGVTPTTNALNRIMEALDKAGAVDETPRKEWEWRKRPPFLKKGAA
jgi:hypothetical protein